jgi:hypothetical protein
MQMNGPELRRWLRGRRLAEERERSEARESHPDPATAIQQALRLIAFAAQRHGWPLPPAYT